MPLGPSPLQGETMRYQVIIGNIGTVYDGGQLRLALIAYGGYKRQSQSGVGRAGDESVVLMDNDEIKYHYTGRNHG